jgi:hypothetical protein
MLGDVKWWRSGVGLLAAVCLFGAAACGSKDEPKKKAEPDDTETTAEDAEDKTQDDKGDDVTIGDGPSVGANVRGLPEGDNYIADNGFRPAKHGFLFPNGDRNEQGRRIMFPSTSPGHLDKNGMRRLFGSERVCLGLEEHQGECLLSPGAYEFMNMVNRKMNGGQCEGLAVFALSLYSGKDPVSVFDEDATLPSELDRNLIRGPVGYYFAYQFLQPFRSYLFGNMMKTTPNEVLDQVIASLKQKDDPVALEFFQPGVGGHAVVPYAVEDKGNKVFHVRIWDNNFPKASRYIEFDKNKNSWLYSFAAINPSEDARPWGGDASRNTIVATPISKRMDAEAVCPFCEKKTGVRVLMTAGGVNALVRDSQGRKLGMDNGKLVNEIPGATAHPVMSFIPGEPPPEPVYELPADEDYDVELIGSGEGKGTMGVFGTDHAMVVEDINIDKGGRDRVNLSRDGAGMDYTPGGEGRKPRIRLAMGTGSDSYRIELNDLKPKKGKKMGFRVNRRLKKLAVTSDGKEMKGLRGRITRFTKKGTQHSVNLKAPAKSGGGVDLGRLTAKAPADKPKKKRVLAPKSGTPVKPKPRLKSAQPPSPSKSKPILKPRKPAPRKPRKPRGKRPPAPRKRVIIKK